MLDRRQFATLLAATAANAVLPRLAIGKGALAVHYVVMVHGLFADGSCWSEVITRLQREDLNVTSVQNPLTTLEEAIAETRRVVSRQDGPTILVGHSFSGVLVSEVGMEPNVTALICRSSCSGRGRGLWRAREELSRRPGECWHCL